MKIGIISGSHRQQSQSRKVADHIAEQLEKDGTDSWIYDLAGNPLPLWDESIWAGDPVWKERLDPIKQQLQSCDGIVVIAPEWHGQVPAGLKNFFLMFSQQELGHKPALIAAVSAGSGGAYPVAELRMSSYKNNRLCYLPEHVLIRDVENVLNADSRRNDERADAYIRERLSWALDILKAYAQALKPVRESGVTQHEKFKNGMS